MAVSNNYTDLLYPLDHPRLAMARGLDARAFGAAVQENPLAGGLINHWRSLADQPYHGLTCDGTCRQGLFPLADESAPTAAATAAAEALLTHLDADDRDRLSHPIDAKQWRLWSNPEFLFNDYGLRLEDHDQATRALVMALILASLGPRGHDKARDCMRTNAFLGELTDLPLIMNEWSYNFVLYGTPGSDGPWGWSMYGHHLCLNCFFLGSQMVVSPVFMGAEPNVIDRGPYAGTRLFVAQEQVGLDLMRSLSPALQGRARIYDAMGDEPSKPAGRWHPADGLHLGGAFQDNRVVPYEGIRGSELDAGQRRMLMSIADAFLDVLPDAPRGHRLARIEEMMDETYWSWIGGFGEEDPFYYRIQSPVAMFEFDHHHGVWLNNSEPAKCHTHTVIRTPNGNDYGKDLLRQHYAAVHPGQAPGRK